MFSMGNPKSNHPGKDLSLSVEGLASEYSFALGKSSQRDTIININETILTLRQKHPGNETYPNEEPTILTR